MKQLMAEFIGTFWLVLGGCGSAVLSAMFPEAGIGFLGVALAFGLALVTMSYALGHISGAHFNPAVSLGLWVGGRFSGAQLLPYILSQVLGGLAGATVLYLIASGKVGFDVSAGFASNGFGVRSPGGYSLLSVLLAEVILTMGFVMVIMGVTDAATPAVVGPLVIGLFYTLIHLISIPVDNTSVNPARSTGVAIFAGGIALQQLWVFWLSPLVGGALGGAIYQVLFSRPEELDNP
ncbi:aquaporin Z [Yersinia rochesterensis]|uniref:aquaporin Z n=1 Tax=Yersinia TaxID=629 RepID=UPI00223F73E4|nr:MULTISPECIES: aquaporin Z [Yersinia]MDA5543717.1 aquaporin Z [Yersinia rochesterensis]MDN0106390.1 aquaporin Z [Yersinia rochesterensis]UZM76375.1 aquaporin Z [Yersinia sp. SCPM-O-B-9106 (C-191)]